MTTVTPTLNLPQPPLSASAAAKTAVAAPPVAPPVPTASPAASPPAPSATVTLSPQALSAMAAASHPASSAEASSTAAAPAPVSHDGSVYESLKNGISSAFQDVEDAVVGGAHAVVDGVETALSTVNTVAKGIVELPFAAVSKAADAAGALIDKL